MFYGCTSLNYIKAMFTKTSSSSYMSNWVGGVVSSGSYVFQSCTSLTSIVCNATIAPTIQSNTFRGIKTGGTLYVPQGSSGYDTWMQNVNYYLGKYNWVKVEQ